MYRTIPQRLAATLVFFSTAGGCADGVTTDELDDRGEASPLPECEQELGPPCDVRERSCQSRLFSLTACLRGDADGTPPRVTPISRDAYRMLIASRRPDTPSPELLHWETALSWIGLVEQGALSSEAAIDFWTNFPIAVFRSREKDVLLIDFTDDLDPSGTIANAVLVHEFAHALQDQQTDLLTLFKEHVTTLDSEYGLASVVEGEARLIEQFALAALNGVPPADIDWPSAFEAAIVRNEEALAGDASPYLTGRGIFPYWYGARFVHRVRRQGGQAAVRALFAEPPASALPALRSVDMLGALDVPQTVFTPPALPEGVTSFADDSLGPWGLFLALLANGMIAPERAHALALAWRGDAFRGYAEASATTLLWEIELAEASLAAEVRRALPENVTGESELIGNRVRIRATDSPRGLGDWP